MVSEKPPADVLEQALARFRGQLTVADASAKSGLPLRDAEEALRALAAGYGGHLAATDKGELVYSFPNGLVKPKETRLARRIGRAIARVALGGLRLVVRAWVSVVLVGYALVFLGILLALTLRGGDDRDSGVGDGLSTVMRVIAEALFWTVHPFSPVFMGTEPRWMHERARRHKLPFYERVNRFVFGPPRPALDPRAQERDVLAEIRRRKGRIAPGDVVRVTGLGREDAEHLLLRMVVDYQGDITVSEDGAILYTFVELRTTAQNALQNTMNDRALREASSSSSSPIWNRRVELAPLTGNSSGWNLLFTFINGFNLAASGFVLANGLTLERLTAIFARAAVHDPELAMLPLPPVDGIPLVLGAIPFAFSLALFALPLVRLLRRPREHTRVARENGWRAVLRQVLATEPRARALEYSPEDLGRAWAAAAGRAPSEAELRAAVERLGGQVDLNADGAVVYKFDVVARELEALLSERARATDDEALPGNVVFSSADAGSGIRDDDRDDNDDDRARTPGSAGTAAARAPAAGGKPDDTAHTDDGQPPPVRLLEEQRRPIELIEELLAEAARRRK